MSLSREDTAAVAMNGTSSMAWIIPNATVFVSSGCIMIIELAAGRIISKHLGASVYVWTAVIGIVLAGIAVGNYLGGLLADRYSSRRTLAKMFMFAAGMSAIISLLDHLVADWSFLWMRTWPVRVASHVACVFFLPTAVLGMISPIVAKMALDLGRETGRTIGDIYAWGVVGSIVGTFLAGFYLIAALGTVGVVWAVAVVLAIMGVLYWRDTWKTWTWAAGLMFLGILATAPYEWQRARSWGEALSLREPRLDTVLYYRESQYSTVEVYQISDEPDIRGMTLDTLLHSQKDMDHPDKFQYEYEKVYLAISKRLRPESKHIDSLTIGGGGYVYPDYMDRHWPASRTDVVEIDPAVTEASFAAFGLPRETDIGYYHEDGRVFIDRLIREREAGDPPPYDFIYCDAVTDYNVPFQLTTREFMTHIHSLIRPDGAYMMNMIDIFDPGLFLGSLVNTMKEIFPHVHVFVEGLPMSTEAGEPLEKYRHSRNTFVIVGTNQPFDRRNLGREYHPDCKIFSLTDAEMAELRERSKRMVLTDTFAPVENLLAPVVRDSAKQKASGAWMQRATFAFQNEDYDEAIRVCIEAIGLFPEDLHLGFLHVWGKALRQKGEIYEAIAKFQKALQIDGKHLGAIVGLMDCYTALGENQRSIPYYRAVLDRYPDDINTRYNFGLALSEAGRHREAVEQFRQVVAIQPNHSGAHNNWGVALIQLGEPEGAVEHFKRAVTGDAKNANLRFNLGMTLLKLNRPKEAVAALQDCLKLDPNHLSAHLILGNAWYALRKAAPALEEYDRALKLVPDHFGALDGRANALAALGRLQEAIKVYQRILELRPDDAEARRRMEGLEERLRKAGAG
ncbi:MAG: fused MFS/spermidine synthase [Phycisphaerae bacterium]